FFFFQAEDGIRDFHVTGVQTCALPILRRPTLAHSRVVANGPAAKRLAKTPELPASRAVSATRESRRRCASSPLASVTSRSFSHRASSCFARCCLIFISEANDSPISLKKALVISF